MNTTERDLLTPREWEVLALVREGLTNEQIAERLGISRDGAKYHVSEILGKLSVSDRIEAAAWYSRNRPAVARFAAFAWPLVLLRRLGPPSGLAAGVVIGVAALVLAAVAAGVIIMEGRSSNDPAPPLVQATGTPQPSPEPSPELPTFAPDGRTGIAELDRIIDDFLTLNAAALAGAYPGLTAQEASVGPDATLDAGQWAAHLAASDRSLYAVLREPTGSGVFPPHDYNVVLSVGEAGYPAAGWRIAVADGRVVELVSGSARARIDTGSLNGTPSSYAGDVGFNYEQFLVLPPRSDLPQPPLFHDLSERTSAPNVDGILALVAAHDADGLVNLLEPDVLRWDCNVPLSPNADRAAETVSRIAEQGVGLRTVAAVPDGDLSTAEHSIILVIEDSPYVWSAAALLERDGRIAGINECPDYAIDGLYPVLAYRAAPLPNLDDLDPARRSGVEVIDAFLDAMADDDIETMSTLIDYEQIGCTTGDRVLGSPPACLPGEEDGTTIDAVLSMQCEGGYTRSIQALLERLAEDEVALYAVADLGPLNQNTDFLRGSYVAVLLNPSPDPEERFVDGFALHFSDQGLTAVRHPCSQTTPDQLVWTGGSPNFLLAPP